MLKNFEMARIVGLYCLMSTISLCGIESSLKQKYSANQQRTIIAAAFQKAFSKVGWPKRGVITEMECPHLPAVLCTLVDGYWEELSPWGLFQEVLQRANPLAMNDVAAMWNDI